MPIMAAHGRNDARAAARLLADAAMECIDDPARAPARAVTLNNVYRLLEAYRANMFFGLDPAASHYHVAETLSLTPPLEQHAEEVRNVIEHAMETTFQGQSKDEAIAMIATVLKKVAYPELGKPSDAEKTKAAQFFSEMAQQLRFA